MKTMYFANTFYPLGIKTVQVVKETAQTVTLARDEFWNREQRRAKTSARDGYFDTWAEAHAFLMAYVERNLASARRALADAQGQHGNVKGMREPEA